MNDVTENTQDRGDEILVAEPGVIFSEEQDDFELVPFREVTRFNQLLTAHGRGGKVIFRIDDLTRDRATDDIDFVSRNIGYGTRPFSEDDGEWLSRYKILLPTDALAGLTRQGNDQNMDTPETLTAYISEGFVAGIVYENNDGRWIRASNQWITLDPSDTSLSDPEGNTTSFEVDPESAADFVDLFDAQHVTEEEAAPFNIEGA